MFQQRFRGRRRKVVRTRPTSVENLEAIPAVPIAEVPIRTEPRALPPPPPVFGPEPVGQVVEGVECPEPEGLQVYPNPDSCNQFYKCANGTLTLETCGNGLLFNEGTSLAGSAHNHCSYNWQTSCGNRPNDSTPISSPGIHINIHSILVNYNNDRLWVSVWDIPQWRGVLCLLYKVC